MTNLLSFLAGAIVGIGFYLWGYLVGRYHGARAALRRISEHNQRVAYALLAAAGPDTEREA